MEPCGQKQQKHHAAHIDMIIQLGTMITIFSRAPFLIVPSPAVQVIQRPHDALWWELVGPGGEAAEVREEDGDTVMALRDIEGRD